MSLSLLLDTSTNYLHMGLVVDGQLVDQIVEKATRQQSEITMVRIQQLFEKNHYAPKDLKQLVISEGPGSYTGIRISMTIAKVLGSLAEIQVYTLNTLQIYAGLSSKSCLALLDARSQRAYVAIYKEGLAVLPPQIKPLAEITPLIEQVDQIVGDTQLIGLKPETIPFIQNMVDLQGHWNPVQDIDHLIPLYLKGTQSYGNPSN